MVRQYIGARYTTKIYTNSNNPASADWESGVSYEPLILVTYNNSSYLSKKLVPSSIGDPASNPDYWVCTGYYNGQMASLQSQINDLNDFKTQTIDIRNRRFILIGDSYGLETNNNGDTYIDLFMDYMKLTDGVNCYHNAVGGASFGSSNLALRFQTLLESIENNISNPDTITDIFVIGGANDLSITPANTLLEINHFASHVRNTFPNAKITLVPLGIILTNTGTENRIKNVIDVWGVSQLYKVNVVPNAQYLLSNTSLLKSDLTHPNSTGVGVIGDALCQVALNGSLDVHYELEFGYSLLTLTSPDTGHTYSLYSSAANGLTLRRVNNVMKTSLRQMHNGFTIIASGSMEINANDYFTVELPNTLTADVTNNMNFGYAYSNNGKIVPLILKFDITASAKKLLIYIPNGIATSDGINTLHCYFDISTP